MLKYVNSINDVVPVGDHFESKIPVDDESGLFLRFKRFEGESSRDSKRILDMTASFRKNKLAALGVTKATLTLTHVLTVNEPIGRETKSVKINTYLK